MLLIANNPIKNIYRNVFFSLFVFFFFFLLKIRKRMLFKDCCTSRCLLQWPDFFLEKISVHYTYLGVTVKKAPNFFFIVPKLLPLLNEC